MASQEVREVLGTRFLPDSNFKGNGQRHLAGGSPSFRGDIHRDLLN